MTALGIEITTKEPTTDWTGLRTSHPRPACQHEWHHCQNHVRGYDRDGAYVEYLEPYLVCYKCGAEDHTQQPIDNSPLPAEYQIPI